MRIAICLAAVSDHGVRAELAWRVSGGDVGVGSRSSFSSLRSSCSSRSATARGRVSLSSSACGGGTAARSGLCTVPGIETAAETSRQGCVSAWPILESEADDAAGADEMGSNVVGDAAEGTADAAAVGAAVGTTVDDAAEDGGMEPGPAIVVTGSVWTGLGDAGWPADKSGAGNRPAWVPASLRLLVRSASVKC